jgi:hypothetical protein
MISPAVGDLVLGFGFWIGAGHMAAKEQARIRTGAGNPKFKIAVVRRSPPTAPIQNRESKMAGLATNSP